MNYYTTFISNVQQTLLEQGLLIIEARLLQTDTPHSVDSSGRVISPTQRPLLNKIQHLETIDIHDPERYEPSIPASERPQTHA
jgi:hypothetical protein